MKQMFKQMKNTDQRSEAMDESKESIADNVTTRNNLFLKTGSDTDLYEVRRRFCIIPVE